MSSGEKCKRVGYEAMRGLVPEVVAGMMKMTAAVAGSGMEKELLELVKMRASQINGCAFCLQMHATDARKAGVNEEKMQLLAVWREAPAFTARERAALACCEALTLVADKRLPEEVYSEMTAVFSEKELVNVVAAVVTINAWNRFAVAFEFVPQVVTVVK